MFRFSLFGIPIEVQPFFWISLVLLGAMNGADSGGEIFKILIFVIAGFISILVHELGHALTARHYGASTHIVLQAFGGYAAYTGARMSRLQSFLVTAAGPAIQILLGIIFLIIWRLFPNLNETGKHFLEILIGISFVWAIINLLPVIPLDGGQMMNAALGPKRIKITLWVSLIVAVVVGVSMFLATTQPLFPIFLGFFAWQAYKALQENHPR